MPLEIVQMLKVACLHADLKFPWHLQKMKINTEIAFLFSAYSDGMELLLAFMVITCHAWHIDILLSCRRSIYTFQQH